MFSIRLESLTNRILQRTAEAEIGMRQNRSELHAQHSNSKPRKGTIKGLGFSGQFHYLLWL